jgi:acyl-CoA reductase-like NAD-dependent aldehyde dehydrogenase
VISLNSKSDRSRFTATMCQVRSSIPLWIDNESVHTPITIPITQASENRVVHDACSASPDNAIAAAVSSWTAFKTWRNSSHITRRDLILRVASYLETHESLFISTQILETSCTEAWATQNVQGSVNYLCEIAAQLSSVTGTIPPMAKAETLGFVFKEPIGPILCIAPWNAALILATRGIASAIGVGCTVVFKASEMCPASHSLITKAFVDSGAPAGVLNQLCTRREDAAEVTETLIAHDAIRKVEFIGSAAVGRQIGILAAKYLKPVLMELGGKCPAIVLEDADLEVAAEQCARGAVLHHGQICFSTERIIVTASVAERLQELLVGHMSKLNSVAGSAVSKTIRDHAEDIVRDAQQRGDEILLGGVDSESGASLKPTIVLNPSSKSRIFDEETFGPSASLYIVSDDKAAIEVANNSVYGLNATVWTKDMARFMRIAKELDYGQVHANSISLYTSPTGSQGGVKGSGFGRMNGSWGLSEFVVEKFVSWSV